MRATLALVVRFAAHAIAEALARRSPGADTYSPRAEVERLVAELSALDAARTGLEPGGAAELARDTLDDLAEWDGGDPLFRAERVVATTRIERDVFRLLLACSLDPRTGILMAHLHDALNETRPTVGALAEILRDPIAVLGAFDPASDLRRCLTASLEPDALAHYAHAALDPRVVRYVTSGELSPHVTTAGTYTLTSAVVVAASTPLASRQRAEPLPRYGTLIVSGPPGIGRRSLGLALAAREQRAALVLQTRAADASALVTRAIRDAQFAGARLIVSGPLDPPSAELLAAAAVPVALVLDAGVTLPEPFYQRPFTPVELPLPSALERTQIWRDLLGDAISDERAAGIAARYAFTPGQIQRASIQATSCGLENACKLQLHHGLDGLATRAQPTEARWDRLVLPPGARESLRAICNQVKHGAHVGETWGFARHHALGHGVKALFFGRPGTGKTLAAEIIANELDMPLYRIDLSRILSKWIGETEQNLGRIFDEAKKGQSILFFDEADSLFAKRTGVSSSTDRYANMEVNYLLQRVEAHEGVILLATNAKANIDEAFARRLHYVVEFPEPDAAARERIWRLAVPPDAPVHAEVDFALLARRFEIPGGAIKNAVLSAAYGAAESDAPIRLAHILVAVRREYDKLDRLYPKGDLERTLAAAS
ncbi:ATP-binding protein [Pendulispora brunnea]|uniref:ATP-binding protein n=1 Tax=Pendulispora brunnea TaxID=2905690 RepID=A0ABZ2KKZ8_9BACT